MTAFSYQPLFEKLGYHFTCTQGLKQALTHASATRHTNLKNNERLEFLGDRVVGLILADLLFEAYPRSEEGDLAKRHAALVSREALYEIAEALDLEAYLKRSPSFEKYDARHKKSSLSDACEALIAALYLESGYDQTKQVVRALWGPLLTQVKETPQDPKSSLQEWAQKGKRGLPVYTLKSKTGPEHEPLFTVEVTVGKTLMAEGRAPSKREAERQAAEQLLAVLAAQKPKKVIKE